jgi:hypothetical protein
VAALALVGLGAPSALAANTRYAEPGGNGAQPCLQGDPCSLPTALTGTGVNGIADGDTVVLIPGTYHPGSGVTVAHRITIEGQPGAPVPLIEAASGSFALSIGVPGDIHDVRIDQANNGVPFGMSAGTAERVFVSNETPGQTACLLYNATMRDSVCEDIAPGGEGISPAISGPTTIFTDTLRNVTAIGDAAGIHVKADSGAEFTLDAANTIASGVTNDVVATSDASPSTSIALTFAHSAYARALATGNDASITPPATNGGVTAAPLFADRAHGDFREAPGSPTIGAGDLSVLVPGELDLGLAARTGPLSCNGPAVVDIGAYQVAAPTGCPVAAPPPPVSPSPVVSPVLQGLRLTHTRFAVVAAKHHRKGIAYGTTLRFTLSAPAKTTLTVWAKCHGHRHGKRCTTKRSSGKACTLLVRIGSETINGHAGANTLRFNGRVGKHTLKPGSYVAKLVAKIGSRASHTLTHDFTIVRG